MSQALHRHYPTQHLPNTFVDVFADSLRLFYCVVLDVLRRTTRYRSQRVSCGRRCTDLSLSGTALFIEGLTPSNTAGISWRPSMPGTVKTLTSSTSPAWRKPPLMWPP